MALLTDTPEDYTKTGNGGITRFANKLSFVPQILKFSSLEKIPVIGGSLTAVLGYVDTIWESAQWLFRGQFGSAATALVAGAVGSTVNGLTGTVFWWANAASGVTTGATLGTHARAGTEAVIGAVTGALGMKPQVLQSYQAGIGSISAGVGTAGPGKFASQVSASRGQNADEAYKRYMAGEGGVHVNELQSANGRGV